MLRSKVVVGVVLVFFLGSIATAAVTKTPSASDSEDPFAYCAQVGTLDTPAGGNTPVPFALEPYLLKGAGGNYWRCMDGAVYVCQTGANLVCDRKIDRATSNLGAKNFCRDNPRAAVVPAYATGHNSLYEWHCRSGLPRRGPPIAKLDPRGFRMNIWHKVVPVLERQ